MVFAKKPRERFNSHSLLKEIPVSICCHLILSLFPSFSLPDMLCDPTDLIWRKVIPFEVMTGRTASSSNGFLVEIFWGFP